MPMQPADVAQIFTQAGLAQVVPSLPQLVQPSIRLTSHATPEAALAVGASKLGGMPDLAPDVAWPLWHGMPMSFIAQIRLEDVARWMWRTNSPRQACCRFSMIVSKRRMGQCWDALFLD